MTLFDRTNLPTPDFGPTGQTVFERTYARPLPDGSLETWADTVERVVRGNISLVYGKPSDWSDDVRDEAQDLFDGIYNFEILPAGRHLWASGVPGRQYLYNCHVSGWAEKASTHAEFTFMRLMEGGGVGANYSTVHTGRYGVPKRSLNLHLTIDESHDDYAEVEASAQRSTAFADEWPGAFRVEDSREGWAAAVVDLLDTYYADEVEHADRVYSLSAVRPKGAPLRTFGGTASGPAPLGKLLRTIESVMNEAYARGEITPLDWMIIDHAIGECVVAGGVRRSARMSILRWDDPYIFEFLKCKADSGEHWTTNISVEVDDAFFEALDGPPEATEEIHTYATVGTDKGIRTIVTPNHAQRVHNAVVAGMLANGEPGYWNSTLSNEGEVNRVDATNPCGEIALEEWENCNLGHVNMEKFAGRQGADQAKAHRLMTRFLIRATFGDVTDPKQGVRLGLNRRIGVGHLGVQGWLVRSGIRYSQAPSDTRVPAILSALKKAVRDEARSYAFELRIPEPVKVTTVAPTGTIAKLCGASEGIHPVYARLFIRRIRFSTLRTSEMQQVEEFRAQGYDVEEDTYAANTLVVSIPTKERLVQVAEDLGHDPSIVEDASEIALEDMLNFQRMYQSCWADNAVSFTVNVPEGKYSVSEVADVLRRFLPHLKGTTLMPDGTRPQAPYERLQQWEYEWYQNELGIGVVDDSYDENCASGACPVK